MAWLIPKDWSSTWSSTCSKTAVCILHHVPYLYITHLSKKYNMSTLAQVIFKTVYMYISGRSCDDQKTILHAAYNTVIILLVIVILALLVLQLRRTRSCFGK